MGIWFPSCENTYNYVNKLFLTTTTANRYTTFDMKFLCFYSTFFVSIILCICIIIPNCRKWLRFTLHHVLIWTKNRGVHIYAGWLNEREDKKLIAVCGSHNFWVIHIRILLLYSQCCTTRPGYNLRVYTVIHHCNGITKSEDELSRCDDVTVLVKKQIHINHEKL